MSEGGGLRRGRMLSPNIIVTDGSGLRALRWSVFHGPHHVFVCLRSTRLHTGVVRELSHQAAREIGECEPAFHLLVWEMVEEIGASWHGMTCH